MTPTQYANDLYANSCKFVDVYDKFTSTEIFIDSVDPFICYSFRDCWATNPQADMNNILFKTKSLLAIQSRKTKAASTNNHATSSKQYR